MKRRDDLKLNILSSIDDDIIERTSKKRLFLMSGGRKRRQKRIFITAGVAAAACLFVVFATLIVPLLSGFSKQVPIYQGMTMSDVPPATESMCINLPDDYKTLDAGDHLPSAVFLAAGDPTPLAHHKPTPPAIGEAVIGDFTPAENVYYAKPDQDVYITVHFHNPDNFEILSFTLNGKKYSSYMFEDGSDMENLVLKVNVGDVQGFVDYTIDAIKYVDETAIKDVIIGGDRTVRIGVYTENQPEAIASVTTRGFHEIGLTVSVTDELNLIADSEGFLKAALIKDGEILQMKDLSVGANQSVLFEGLESNTAYIFTMIAAYDAADGNGFASYILSEQEVLTAAFTGVEITSATSLDTSFTLAPSENIVKSITDVTVTDANGKTVASGDIALRKLVDLIPRETYTLTISFTYDLGDGNGVREGVEKTEIYIQPLQNISYTVKHYVEALDGTFTLKETENLNGEEATSVTPATRTYEGLTTPATQTVSIKRDGGTVVEYRYTRNSYTVTFVTNGGKAIATQSLKYESALPTATRGAFTFGGWFDDVALSNAVETVPAKNVTLYAYWSEENKPSDFAYHVSGTVEITNYTSIDTTVCIPSHIGGNAVTSIGDSAFFCTGLTSITIPDSVTSIGLCAFSGCSSLTSITIPGSVTSIGYSAFDACSSLTSITIPGSVTSIGNSAFYECSSLTIVTILGSVTSIGDSAFDGCVNLTTITIPDSVTSIGDYAFDGCANLTSITIPGSVTSIGKSAFDGCYKLVEVINKSSLSITAGSRNYGCVAYYAKEVHNGATKIVNQNDYLFYTYGGVNYLLGYVGTDTALTLPASYNGQNYEIYRYAFYRRSSLTSITILGSVTNIGDHAFDFCTDLTSITIPGSVTSIGVNVFSVCIRLTSIKFNGTTAQWSTISPWTANVPPTDVPATEVVCSDGTVIL